MSVRMGATSPLGGAGAALRAEKAEKAHEADTTAKTKKAHDLVRAAHDFEAILVRSMLAESGAMGKKSGAYGDMAASALAGSIADGPGLGLGEAIRSAVERAEASRNPNGRR